MSEDSDSQQSAVDANEADVAASQPTTPPDVSNASPQMPSLSGGSTAPAPDVSNPTPTIPTYSGPNPTGADVTANPAAALAQARSDQAHQPTQGNTDVSPLDNAGLRQVGQTAPFFSRLLMGALSGLGGVPSHGRPSFLNGLGEGARAQEAAAQQQKENAFQQQQADAKNIREDQSADDIHKMHMASETLTQMNIDRIWDQLHPDAQKNITQNLTQQATMLESNGVHPENSTPYSENDGKNALKQAILVAATNDPESTFSYSLYPSLKPDEKGMWNIYKTPNSNLLAPFPVTTHNPISGKPETQTYPVGTPLSTIHAILTKDNDQQVQIGTANQKNVLEQQTAKGKADIAHTQAETNKLNQKNADAKANGDDGPRWQPKVTADEKKKAELAENIAFNANEVSTTLARRPDLVGPAAGRYTNTEQMIGNNDKDISAIGNEIHNMAMANSGVHGFRSQEGVAETEKNLLNNFTTDLTR